MHFRVNEQPLTWVKDNCYKSSINKFSYSIRKYFSRSDSTKTRIIYATRGEVCGMYKPKLTRAVESVVKLELAAFSMKNPYLHTHIKLQGFF